MSEVFGALREALESGDLDRAREAFDNLDVASGLGELEPDRVENVARLLDLGQLATELAHELRQPATGIKAYAQMLRERPDRPESVTKRATSIEQQAIRVEAIIDRVRAYARGGSAGGAVQPCELGAIVSEVVELMGFDRPGARVSVHVPAKSVRGRVLADPVGLQQILVNLLGNAREALPDGAGEIRVDISTGDGHIRLTVHDDGPGIPREQRGRIFERFVTHKDQGTGLGLYVSRRIAERLGGTLELVESNAGAKFLLRLPPAPD